MSLVLSPLSNLHAFNIAELFQSQGILSSLQNQSMTSLLQQQSVFSILRSQSQLFSLDSRQQGTLNLLSQSMGLGQNIDLLA